MSQLPVVPGGGESDAERRLSPEQFEQVIRRASELQAKKADDASPEGISQHELIRIGREIGIAPQYVQQALTETLSDQSGVPSRVDRVFGPPSVVAMRTVPGNADAVREHIDLYLREREWLAALRRFPNRTIYRKARGVDLLQIVNMTRDLIRGRSSQPQVGAGFKLKDAKEVVVQVDPLEDGYSYVTLTVDVRNYRMGYGAAGLLGGGGGALATAVPLGIAVDPLAALLGLPVLGIAMWGFRAGHLHVANHAKTHLESLLDTLERSEQLVRTR